MFVDIAKIKIKAGDGGDGAVAFHREKYVAAGGPDGGDGGRGGNVVFVADDSLSTLADFRYKRKYTAQNGQNGRGARCNGKKGEDLVIRVPRGTVIREAESGAVMADLSSDEPFVAARGGKGGFGNRHFATPTRQTPRFAKSGAPGEAWEVTLELKLIADVGLLGFPNVGKSSLLSVVSEAKPAVGDYHFTTLTPVLGVVRMGEGQSFVMADIPGLIEGAADGVGLGHDFLRHVERCRMLVHLVDVAGSEGRDPVEDFEKINAELRKFNAQLAELPQIVAGNKIDLAEDAQRERFRAYIEKQGLPYFEIVAPIRYGTKELIDAAGIPITRDMGLMLLGGMLTDSGHFQFARPAMLPAFADIMSRCGIEMDEAMELTQAPVSMSERIAMMKAIERTRFDRVGEMIVAISFGGSFEASSCRAIMAAGADVVFVGSQRDENFRLSARATQEAVRKGIHLGEIMSGIGEETMSDGGGHGGAAGLTGIGDTEAMLNICMSRTMDVFRDIKKRDMMERESSQS